MNIYIREYIVTLKNYMLYKCKTNFLETYIYKYMHTNTM